MNSIRKVVALSTLMNNVSKYVEKNFIKIIPGIIGNNDPFKLEDGNLYVPDQAYLSNLQKESAIYGFESQRVLRYCKSLLKLLKTIVSVEMMAPFRVFQKSVMDEKSKSDEIISFVKKRQGYSDYKEILPETVQDFAVKTSETIFKNLVITKKMIQEIYPC